MTASNRETIEIFNDLIEINQDRVESYRSAIKELRDDDLVLAPMFEMMINDSLSYNKVLSREVDILGGEIGKHSSLTGKIYRAWITIKNALGNHSRLSILDTCEQIEDATLDAYRSALQSLAISDYLKEIVSDQLDALLHAHDKIKRMRDRARKKVI
jgi:uncharacterized protein (TIGR02284 family)